MGSLGDICLCFVYFPLVYIAMRLRWHLPLSLAITMFELHGVLVDIINYLWLMSGRPLSFCNGIKKDHNFSTAKSPHETIKRIYYVCNQTGSKATSISTRAHFAYKSIVSKLFISLDAYIEGL